MASTDRNSYKIYISVDEEKSLGLMYFHFFLHITVNLSDVSIVVVFS